MSNVRIEAIGDEGLSIEVLLGTANRAWHDIAAGDYVDLAVGGNQTLLIGPAREEPSIFITPDDQPAVETSWVEDKDKMPIGVDVQPVADQADLEGYRAVAPVGETDGEDGGTNPEAADDGAEKVTIGAEDVGDISELFVTSEIVAEVEIVKDLEADSPLETGSIADLPNPFDEDQAAESKDDPENQA